MTRLLQRTLPLALLTLCALGLSTQTLAATKKKVVKKVAKAAPAVAPKGTLWKCEHGAQLHIDGNISKDLIVTLYWQGKAYKLPRIDSPAGADRYTDNGSGMSLMIIPSKAMLLHPSHGRLADECKTEAMLAGAPAPTRAEELRAPVAPQPNLENK